MKIQDLKATVVSVPLKSDLTSVRSPGPQDRLRTRVVKVETDEGVTGEVYACNSANGMSIPFREMRQLVVGACKELAVGEDPFAIERVWERLSQVSARTENKEAAMRAISAVDIALWDVIGKVSNMPLHKLLGGYKEELPAMGDGGKLGGAGPGVNDRVHGPAERDGLRRDEIQRGQGAGGGRDQAHRGHKKGYRRRFSPGLRRGTGVDAGGGDKVRQGRGGVRHSLVRGAGALRRRGGYAQGQGGHHHTGDCRTERAKRLRVPEADAGRCRGLP